MVNGEGSGAFVLETESHARARGAPILARIIGSARTYGDPGCDERFGSAIRRSIDLAVQAANLSVGDVDHVNANGLSTLAHDPLEAQAIHASLADVPVTAPKSFFGNLGAGGGAVELAASVLACQTGSVPHTLNHRQTDSSCPVRVIGEQAKPMTQPAVVAINQSQTGQATAAVIVRN